MEGLAGKITSSLHKSNFACYNGVNSITSTADEYNFTSYNCISNITICGRTVEEDYPSLTVFLQPFHVTRASISTSSSNVTCNMWVCAICKMCCMIWLQGLMSQYQIKICHSNDKKYCQCLPMLRTKTTKMINTNSVCKVRIYTTLNSFHVKKQSAKPVDNKANNIWMSNTASSMQVQWHWLKVIQSIAWWDLSFPYT